jgi:S-DNA-T family DNA segregation ATPase FtsK/SpoIIIE
VVVIDEYAELVTILPKTEREEFERQILRLAQRARAVGIHMIIATQRPTTEFVTGAVKANLPTRISFRLPQRVDSMTIIDQPGAENLLGAGDMLLLHEGRLQRLQGYFVSMDEIATLVAELAQPKEKT